MKDWFLDRTGVLATMHQKEQAIAPLVEQALGLELHVPSDFDTDRFGTFTREVKRPAAQLETARLKAIAAMEQTGLSVGIASEGAFGPHPLLPYLATNRELVLLIDRDRNLELVGEYTSTETNFSHTEVNSPEAAQDFAAKAGFPNHALVVMGKAERLIAKGITSVAELIEAVEAALRTDGVAHLETDMRAMHNPTRMKAIAAATQHLIQQFQQRCPQCDWPGFAIAEREPGLPCELCHAPTELTLAVMYRCRACHFTQRNLFPNGMEAADPGQCPYCNP